MALTYLNIQDIVLDLIDRSETEDRTRIKQFINMAARDVWTSKPWRERRKTGVVETVAPYTTGTVTVTEDSGVVTGSGTTFPATNADQRKFALSYTLPWYTVTTRDSSTQLTLGDNYAEDTASAQTYTFFQDVYRLASDVDTVLGIRLQRAGYGGTLGWLSERRMDEMLTLPAFAGVPQHFCMQDLTSASLRTVKVWPVPDDTYRFQYRYLKSFTEMSADADECVIPENRRDLIIQRAAVWAYQYVREFDRAVTQYAFYTSELERHWKSEQDAMPRTGRMRRFDEWGRGGGSPLTLPVADV